MAENLGASWVLISAESLAACWAYPSAAQWEKCLVDSWEMHSVEKMVILLVDELVAWWVGKKAAC